MYCCFLFKYSIHSVLCQLADRQITVLLKVGESPLQVRETLDYFCCSDGQRVSHVTKMPQVRRIKLKQRVPSSRSDSACWARWAYQSCSFSTDFRSQPEVALLRLCCFFLPGPFSWSIPSFFFSGLLHTSKEAVEFLFCLTAMSQSIRLTFTDKYDCLCWGQEGKNNPRCFFRVFQISPQTTA